MPTLIWQQPHGWPQLRMTPVVAGEAEALYGGRAGIAVELLVFAGLATLVLGMAGLYAPLAAAGALGLQRRREAGGAPRPWLVWPAWLAATAVAAGTLVVSVSITRSDVGENIARRTADAYRALPAAQRDRTVIVGESYVVAAFLDGEAPKYHLPTAYSTSRSYGYFLTGQGVPWETLWPRLRTLTLS